MFLTGSPAGGTRNESLDGESTEKDEEGPAEFAMEDEHAQQPECGVDGHDNDELGGHFRHIMAGGGGLQPQRVLILPPNDQAKLGLRQLKKIPLIAGLVPLVAVTLTITLPLSW